MARRKAEILLENHRTTQYPNLPSRAEAIFLCRVRADLEHWVSVNRPFVYRLEATTIVSMSTHYIVWYKNLPPE